MKTPPIIDYEGSDYQQAFWERGGRAYEDAVEAIALQRLLPKRGKLLLEVGAGAGRNTPRYRGFERVVLLDYSRSQLLQARQRLGVQAGYRFVAGDVYRLPFVEGLFDAATMIRTLHHLSEPSQALNQVRRTLQPGAHFILEFSNKRNLKAILRYALQRQDWNPFLPEPVEFTLLNFDFHPDAVQGWLSQNEFEVERWLTVSHFRLEILKRLLPLGVLVWLDALLQPTGAWWQLTPSVFVRAIALGETHAAAEGFFRCPACSHSPLADTPPRLVCPACGAIYPVEDDIYDFRLRQDAAG
ncbi:MAG: methyltransferase domain-containing protein [Anaerolineaceae bacterium]|nr:methyltransferase domain-containing protein [Anaerolineaceae bacterium]